MSELDDKIRQALREEDRELFEAYSGEPGLFGMVAESFRGRHRWLVALVWLWSLVFFILSIVAAVQFFYAETTRAMLAWAIGFIYCTMAVAMLKSWYWMEMNKNIHTREIKRLELQIARLAQRIEEK
jgi:hypothetical protein